MLRDTGAIYWTPLKQQNPVARAERESALTGSKHIREQLVCHLPELGLDLALESVHLVHV